MWLLSYIKLLDIIVWKPFGKKFFVVGKWRIPLNVYNHFHGNYGDCLVMYTKAISSVIESKSFTFWIAVTFKGGCLDGVTYHTTDFWVSPMMSTMIMCHIPWKYQQCGNQTDLYTSFIVRYFRKRLPWGKSAMYQTFKYFFFSLIRFWKISWFPCIPRKWNVYHFAALWCQFEPITFWTVTVHTVIKCLDTS